MILLIDNYDSFTYNLYQAFEKLGGRCKVVRNDAITVREIKKLGPHRIVISPGPGNPDSAGISLDVIRELGPRIPLLGVCLGHQAIAQAFGGRVIRAPRQMHGKISAVHHLIRPVNRPANRSDRGSLDRGSLYQGVNSPFQATRYHSLIVERSSLPECLEITAETRDGGKNRTIMGLRHRSFAIEGVQFHPESIMTLDGETLLGNFIKKGVRHAHA